MQRFKNGSVKVTPIQRPHFLRQIEFLLANNLVPEHHMHYILEAKRCLLAKEEEMDFDSRMIFAAIRADIRTFNVIQNNKKRHIKGKHRKERSPAHKAAIAAAQMKRWKEAKARGEYANGKKPQVKAKKATD